VDPLGEKRQAALGRESSFISIPTSTAWSSRVWNRREVAAWAKK
jgi:hypothetical protein